MNGDVSDEESIQSGFKQAQERFGPMNILIVNSSLEDKTNEYPIWDLPLDEWERNYRVNVRGSFLAIKHFLRGVREYQQISGAELASPAIVVTETETGTGLAAGKAGLHYGLLNTVRDEIKQLNSEARINAVTRGLINKTGEIATTPADVARTMAFLASKRASGHISGQSIRVEDNEYSISTKISESKSLAAKEPVQSIPQALSKPKRNKIRVAVSIDLDAVSGWLGTSKSNPSSSHHSS